MSGNWRYLIKRPSGRQGVKYSVTQSMFVVKTCIRNKSYKNSTTGLEVSFHCSFLLKATVYQLVNNWQEKIQLSSSTSHKIIICTGVSQNVIGKQCCTQFCFLSTWHVYKFCGRNIFLAVMSIISECCIIHHN